MEALQELRGPPSAGRQPPVPGLVGPDVGPVLPRHREALRPQPLQIADRYVVALAYERGHLGLLRLPVVVEVEHGGDDVLLVQEPQDRFLVCAAVAAVVAGHAVW